MSSRCWRAPKSACTPGCRRTARVSHSGSRPRTCAERARSSRVYLRLSALAAHVREHGYDQSLAHQAFEVFLTARNQLQPFEDVAPALARLRQRYRLATLSNGNADLARIGLDEAFTVSLNARQIGAAKPHRSCFERLARELGLASQEILHVGDDPLLDVEGARAAGFVSAWMNRRARAWPPELAVPEVMVTDCAQLAALLGV